MTDRPQDEETPRVVVTDKRRIDPTSGQVRVPAGASPVDVPAGTAGPSGPSGSPTAAAASTATPGEQMSQQTGPGPEVDQPDAVGTDVPDGQPAAQDATAQAQQTDAPQTDDARQLAERTEDLQRVSAEYANYRRRVDRDRTAVVDQAAERFAAQLIPVVDDIERAREHGDLTGAFKVVADRVLGLLDGLGVTTFGAAGDPFDPALHEAVLHDSSAEVSVPTATTVLRPGFRRGERVLRSAMVGVTDPENPAPAAPQPTEGVSPVDDQPAS